MRMVGLAALVLGALVAPAWSGDIYSWTDGDGSVHYSNTPAAGAKSEHLAITDSEPAQPASAPGATGGTPATGEAPTAEPNDDADFSTKVSLQRTAIERSMREVERRIADLDGRLAGLARARTAHDGGSAATGGVAANATGVVSEEERTVQTQRQELADQLASLQQDYAKLRTAVVARVGTTPPWWVEYRTRR